MRTYYYGRDINSGKVVEFEKPVEGTAGDMCICLNEDDRWHVVKLENDLYISKNDFLQITRFAGLCEGMAAQERKFELEKKMNEYLEDMDRQALGTALAAYDEEFKKVWDEYVKLDS